MLFLVPKIILMIFLIFSFILISPLYWCTRKDNNILKNKYKVLQELNYVLHHEITLSILIP